MGGSIGCSTDVPPLGRSISSEVRVVDFKQLPVAVAVQAIATWIAKLAEDPQAASALESWPSHGRIDIYFDWTQPTTEAYRIPGKESCSASSSATTHRFAQARSKLDYSYHPRLYVARQILQDAILSRLQSCDSAEVGSSQRKPWIVFTAGAMGVGKSYAMLTLSRDKLFPLEDFVIVDPDKLKSELPEVKGYTEYDPPSAATKLHRESTMMADILFEHSLEARANILVDGSLRDVAWYTQLFDDIRQTHPAYQLGIIHISADRSTIIERAEARATASGRVVPMDLLNESMEQVPKSVEALSPLADVVAVIANDNNSPLQLRSLLVGGVHAVPSWAEFEKVWAEERSSSSVERSSSGPDSTEQQASWWSRFCCPKAQRRTMYTGQSHDLELYKKAIEVYQYRYPSVCSRCIVHANIEAGYVCSCCQCHKRWVVCAWRWIEKHFGGVLWRLGHYDQPPPAVYGLASVSHVSDRFESESDSDASSALSA
eukprot:TRINITY_DN16520_c0_g7_i1.p1 TRINITY_DN16520_c0_g7~~TRINITY_DN16520_c0_g7_i1.p1  ORF type:complete len:499 (+),score=49.04 TRINITY_DN16520_c0_g7_i1:37-1497(+)